MTTRLIPEHDRPSDARQDYDETDWVFQFNYEYILYKKRKDRKLDPGQFGIFGDVPFEQATIAYALENFGFFRHYNTYLKTRFDWISLTEEESFDKMQELNYEHIFFFPPDHGLKLAMYLTEHKDVFTDEKAKKSFQWICDNCDIADCIYFKQNCKEILKYIQRPLVHPNEERGTIDVVLEMNELNERCSDELAIRAEHCFNNEYGHNTFALMFFPWNIHIFRIPHVLLTVDFLTKSPMLNYQYVMWGNIFMTLFCHQQNFESTFRYFETLLNSHGLSLHDQDADLIFM